MLDQWLFSADPAKATQQRLLAQLYAQLSLALLQAPAALTQPRSPAPPRAGSRGPSTDAACAAFTGLAPRWPPLAMDTGLCKVDTWASK